ncbi:MAG: GumC family protein [Pontibacterium sp.]
MVNVNSDREASKFTFRDIVSIFFYTKRAFILTFVSVIVGALLVAFLSTPVYQVAARVVVKPKIEKPVIFDGDASRVNIGDTVSEKTLNTVVHLFTSTEVIREVIEVHNLVDTDNEAALLEAIGDFRGRVSAEPLAQSNLVSVSLSGTDPEQARDQLNTLLDSYVAYHIRVNQGIEGSMEFFDQQANLYKEKYIQLSNELAAARKRLNVSNAAIQADAQLTLARDLQARKAQIETNLEAAEEQLRYLRSAYRNVGTREFVGLAPSIRQNYPALVEMERSLAQLIINLQRAQSDFTPNAKPVVDAKLQYTNMRGQIQDYMADIIDAMQLEVDTARRQIGALDSRIDDTNSGVGQMSADDVILQRIEFERELAEENYRLYENKREEARISEEKDKLRFANISIASRPLAPTSPWFPNRPLIILLSIPLAVLLGLVASILAYSSNQTVRSPSDITARTRLRILGTLDAV